MAKRAKVYPRTPEFTDKLLKEFRVLYTNIFKDKETVEETPDVLDHPDYKRYCQLAPMFYSMMLKRKREVGLL